jgi:hypothetical protein
MCAGVEGILAVAEQCAATMYLFIPLRLHCHSMFAGLAGRYPTVRCVECNASIAYSKLTLLHCPLVVLQRLVFVTY